MGAFALACAITLLATPLAIRLARATQFYDRPGGYKEHARATPYLGGAAVVLGFGVAAIAFGGSSSHVAALLACALALTAIGTLDDRVGLGIVVRLGATVSCAAALHTVGLGWSIFSADGANLALTVVFVVGVVNAYNLMDNLDGAAATVTIVGAGAAGVIAALHGDLALGVIAFALTGACAGFLPYNLGGPARIFLGDGGSMPVGLVVSVTIMALSPVRGMGWETIAVAVVLVGLPALDTALVIVSRLRRRVGVLSGGRDHLTHRLLARAGSPQRVAAVLALTQGMFSAVALVLFEVGGNAALLGAACCIALGVALVAALETPAWSPGAATEELSA